MSKFAGIPLAPCQSPANTTQEGRGQEQPSQVEICRDPFGALRKSCKYHTKRKRVGTTLRVEICRDPLGALRNSCKYHTKRQRVGTTLHVEICRDPLGALPKSCKYHTRRKRAGTTFTGRNLPGSPWRPAKVLQIPHKTEEGRNNFAG